MWNMLQFQLAFISTCVIAFTDVARSIIEEARKKDEYLKSESSRFVHA